MGLIFADLGLRLHIGSEPIVSAVVIMVMVSTLATPPALAAAFRGAQR